MVIGGPWDLPWTYEVTTGSQEPPSIIIEIGVSGEDVGHSATTAIKGMLSLWVALEKSIWVLAELPTPLFTSMMSTLEGLPTPCLTPGIALCREVYVKHTERNEGRLYIIWNTLCSTIKSNMQI